MTVAGTTDAISEVTFSPKPRNADIEFILSEIRGYLNHDITGNIFFENVLFKALFQYVVAM